MFKDFREKIAASGFTVLAIGIVLLVFTFVSAYGFLTESLSLVSSQDLVQMFGEALAPLIATCIRIMYLGIMGWIGSILTIRGVTIVTNAPKMDSMAQSKPLVPQQTPVSQKAQKGQAQKETRKPEPEIVVVPPEAASKSRQSEDDVS